MLYYNCIVSAIKLIRTWFRIKFSTERTFDLFWGHILHYKWAILLFIQVDKQSIVTFGIINPTSLDPTIYQAQHELDWVNQIFHGNSQNHKRCEVWNAMWDLSEVYFKSICILANSSMLSFSSFFSLIDTESVEIESDFTQPSNRANLKFLVVSIKRLGHEIITSRLWIPLRLGLWSPTLLLLPTLCYFRYHTLTNHSASFVRNYKY